MKWFSPSVENGPLGRFRERREKFLNNPLRMAFFRPHLVSRNRKLTHYLRVAHGGFGQSQPRRRCGKIDRALRFAQPQAVPPAMPLDCVVVRLRLKRERRVKRGAPRVALMLSVRRLRVGGVEAGFRSNSWPASGPVVACIRTNSARTDSFGAAGALGLHGVSAHSRDLPS